MNVILQCLEVQRTVLKTPVPVLFAFLAVALFLEHISRIEVLLPLFFCDGAGERFEPSRPRIEARVYV